MLLVLGFGRHESGRYVIPRFARLRLCSRLHIDRFARMPTLLRPQRSAHASIRGYLYQTALGVLRWLELEDGEGLVFEGDEDLDRLMIADPTTEGISEQVKAYQGKLGFGDRVVRENVRNFLVAYVALRERGEKRRFVFTTTAAARREAELERWQNPAAQREVVGEVRQWALGVASEKDRDSVHAALAWLGRGKKRWREFLDAVEWRFGAPELGEVRRQVGERVKARGFAVPSEIAFDRLLWEAFEASRQEEAEKRLRTRGDLEVVLGGLARELSIWAGRVGSTVFRRVEDEDAALARLLDSGRRELPKPREGRSLPPGLLLQAAHEVVPFAGRQAELAAIESWCGEAEGSSVWLWSGEGGVGKTRFALEVIRRLGEAGWVGGFLPSTVADAELSQLGEGEAPRLVVVDYAESRLETVKVLFHLLARATLGPTMRLLLLTRRRGEWWEGLGRLEVDFETLLYRAPDPATLAALALDGASRFEEYRRAVATFAAVLVARAPVPLPPLVLREDEQDRVLFMHMAALALVQGDDAKDRSLLARTLDHERKFWREAIEDLEVDAATARVLERGIERALAAITLAGGAHDAGSALAWVERAAGLDSAERRDTVVDLLHQLYPGRDGEAGYVEPLLPDLLGEELVKQVLANSPRVLAAVLDQGSDAERERALTVLTRLVQREVGETKWLEQALRGRLEVLGPSALEVAIGIGEPMDSALAERVEEEASFELAMKLEGRCVDDPLLHFSGHVVAVALAATKRASELARAAWKESTEDQQAELARLLSNLSVRQSNAGQREAALVSAGDAVKTYRRLAQSRPEIHEPNLAISLNNLGNLQSDLRKVEEALASAAESVEIYRRLAQSRPEAYEPDLARSLNNLGKMQSALGQREEALGSAAESVEIRRRLAQSRPEVQESYLARSLNNLGLRQSDLGQVEEGLASAAESVEIYRRLAHSHPEVYEPDLAMSLNNLASMQSDLDQREAALASAAEALEIYRRLAQSRPEVHEPYLARNLNNLGLRRSNLGRREEALASTAEAVKIYRQLAHSRPEVYEPDLAMSLSNRGLRQSDLGQWEEALASAAEAAEIYRRLALSRPDVYEPDLARSLGSWGKALRGAERWVEAEESFAEGLALIFRSLAARPQVFGGLATSLARDYLAACEAAKIEPDTALLQPITEVLERLRSAAEESHTTAPPV